MTSRVPVSQRVPSVSEHTQEGACSRVPPPLGGNTERDHGSAPKKSQTVSRPLPGVNAALANAIRQLNAAFNRLPEEIRDRLDLGWDEIDAELDEAVARGDAEDGLRAITRWRDHHLRMFREATK